MAEQRSPKPQVGGSIPSWPAIFVVHSKESLNRMADKIKLLIAALILGGALYAFYAFEEYALVLRVLGLLVAVVIAGFVATRTAVGGGALAFTRGAVVEVRKVVWPTRKETVQTTIMVMAMVVVVGIILWVFDWVLAWAVQLLTGQGG